MAHRREGRGGRETAAADRDKLRVGVGQTVLRQRTNCKHHVDLYGFSWLGCASSPGGLLGGAVETAPIQYRTARGPREIPGRSWRASARAGCWSSTLKAGWQYCRRGALAVVQQYLPQPAGSGVASAGIP